MIQRLLLDHPRTVGETYFQHMRASPDHRPPGSVPRPARASSTPIIPGLVHDDRQLGDRQAVRRDLPAPLRPADAVTVARL